MARLDGFSYWTVQFEPSWEQDLERLRRGQPPPAPIDEVLEAFDWTVARIGDSYAEVGGTRLRVVEILPSRGLLRLNAWFTFGEDRLVHGIAIDEVGAAEEEDEDGGLNLFS
jgi:hypothetical protein